jgi:heterodisulfide reductase subunit B
MSIGYFPGCSQTGTAKQYDESLRAVCRKAGIEIKEIDDWNCCGATAAHSMNRKLSVALPARNLALAENQGLNELLVPCAACYSRMMTGQHEFLDDNELNKTIPDIIGMPLEGTSKIFNVLEFINEHVSPNLKSQVVKPLNKKVACYYGCLLVRPPKLVKQDRYEDPTMMDDIMKLIGADPIDWAFKTECCGAGLSVSKTDIVGKLSGKIVGDAIDRGAEAIIVACPMCHSNLDLRRPELEESLGRKTDIPVLFITQAIGYALGMSDSELGMQRNSVNVDTSKFTTAKPIEEAK